MKKIVLSMAAIATVSMAGGEIAAVNPVVEPAAQKSILDRVHFKGDLRLRYESRETTGFANGDSDSLNYRNRYRLRLNSTVDLNDNLKFEFGMRSGYANPTSGNQTFESDEALGDYFFKSLRVNKLGFKHKSGNTTYKVGRQPYMMYRPIKSQLVWDNDISMNGVNYQYKDASQIITLGVNQPTLEEAARDNVDDINLLIAQYVHKTKFDSAKLNLGAGAYIYDGIKGNATIFNTKSMGNTVSNGLYTNDYHLVEGFAELKYKDVLGKPFAVAAGFVNNTAASDNNFGYDIAFKLGKAKNVNDWQVKYSYTELEEDAAFGAYTDSDNFSGGTAAKGHAIRAKYKAGKNIFLAGNFFFNELYEGKEGKAAADYERVQLDMIYKF